MPNVAGILPVCVCENLVDDWETCKSYHVR